MADRKVLIKYYPPDFNPAKLIKNVRPRDKQDNVRMMLPMSILCNSCGNYLYIGTKFNMRKETCLDEHYLNIRIYRFYLQCTYCYNQITFKTDPKNHDYVVEHGATRNYDPWRDAQAAEQALKDAREIDEDGDAMRFLENRTSDSKREMDILDGLDQIRILNKRQITLGPDELLRRVIYSQIEKEQNIDENMEEQDLETIQLLSENGKIQRIADDPDDQETNKEDQVENTDQNLENQEEHVAKQNQKEDGDMYYVQRQKLKTEDQSQQNQITNIFLNEPQNTESNLTKRKLKYNIITDPKKKFIASSNPQPNPPPKPVEQDTQQPKQKLIDYDDESD